MSRNGKRRNGHHLNREHKRHRGARRNAPPVPLGEEAYTLEEYREIRDAVRLEGDWDVLLVGDGSAKDRGGACSWAATLYDRSSGRKRVFYGAASEGSCLMAELVPYLQAMLWYARFRGRKLLRERGGRPLKVVVVTDSMITANQGSRLREFLENPRRLVATRPLWLAIDHLAGTGYEFTWRWLKRGTIAGNRDMNRLAQAARCRIESMREQADDRPEEHKAM